MQEIFGDKKPCSAISGKAFEWTDAPEDFVAVPAEPIFLQGKPGAQLAVLESIEKAAATPLTIAHFQRVNVQRCTEAMKHSLDDWSLLEWAGALAGEVGEAANLCKKIRRRQGGHGGEWAARDPDIETMRRELAGEIGDCFAYLVLLAAAAGLDAATCAAEKFDAISGRVGWKGERLLPELAESTST